MRVPYPEDGVQLVSQMLVLHVLVARAIHSWTAGLNVYLFVEANLRLL